MILVLVMTLSLAGLAISAIYLMSSANLLTSYYNKERDFRYAAEQAVALAKSRATHDTTLAIPDDTALTYVSGGTLTDAYGTAIPGIKVNTYISFTGDTSGRYGKFITILSQSYDTGGTRTVRRLDLTSESFSRYAMFADSFPSGLTYGPGEFIRGRSHSNTNWYAATGSTFYDTVSVPTGRSISTGPTYTNGTTYTSGRIPFPTVAKLAALPGYATSGNLNFTPVAGTSTRDSLYGVADLSGHLTSGSTVARATRIRFKYFDDDMDGVIEEYEGFMEVFDLAPGIDTATLRVDLPRATSSPWTPVKNIVMLNQCGINATIGGKTEFFPAARFREPWVVHRIRSLATSPVMTAADSTTVVAGNAAAYSKILSYGVGISRCYAPGSPQLMLTERNVNSTCTAVSTDTSSTSVYGWGAPGAGCAAAKQYGGQDTTFTANVYRCYYDQTVQTGICKSGTIVGSGGGTFSGSQVRLGAWRTFGGTAMTGTPASKIDPSENNYLWPLFKPNNLSAKGVIYSGGRLYASDTLRGNLTLYVMGSLVFIDDLVYDQDPTATSALCRNFLGVIARDSVMIADNALNRPRYDPAGTVRFLGTPNATLHMVTMSLTATVGVENYAGGPSINPTTYCQGNPQSGGCVNQTGGVIEKFLSATYGSGASGLRETRTVDPCQLTNHKPPFFPQTGRYLDNKYYEIDPTKVSTWATVKNYYASLRGRSVP
ncbi:MAG: hypothetical protein HYR75_03865 [Gemmatimonadetes bacterium]|nr:hypothetical protein [Gemmatimonadota bacterium]